MTCKVSISTLPSFASYFGIEVGLPEFQINGKDVGTRWIRGDNAFAILLNAFDPASQNTTIETYRLYDNPKVYESPRYNMFFRESQQTVIDYILEKDSLFENSATKNWQSAPIQSRNQLQDWLGVNLDQYAGNCPYPSIRTSQLLKYKIGWNGNDAINVLVLHSYHSYVIVDIIRIPKYREFCSEVYHQENTVTGIWVIPGSVEISDVYHELKLPTAEIRNDDYLFIDNGDPHHIFKVCNTLFPGKLFDRFSLETLMSDLCEGLK